MALSDTWLKANHKKERPKTETKSDRDGLSVRISPKGKITFQLRYRHDGNQKRIDLGTYPNITLKQARSEVTSLRERLEKGHDPKTVKALERTAIVKAVSFEDVTRAWYLSDCEGRVSNAPEILKSFELHIFPTYGDLPANQITTRHWYDLLEPLANKKPSIAKRVIIYGKQIYRWAVRREMLEYNPMADISSARDLRIKEKQGSRILDDSELGLIWEAIEQSNIAHRNRLFLKLALVYGCRGNELRTAEKGHFDFKGKIWTIPTEFHKTGKSSDKPPLFRPIIPATEPWFREVMDLSNSDTLLFTSTRTDGPMKRTSSSVLPYNLMQWIRKNKGINMEHWSLHDLRRTARTNWSSITSRDIAEMMLGHVLPGVQGVYDKHAYMDEKREAYEKWWDRLQTLVN